jgi:hypothetical protein
MDLKGSTLDLPMILLAAVSKLDFLELGAEEYAVLNTAGIKSSVRKVRITFRDGAIRDNTYVDCSLTEWKGKNESGNLYSPRVRSITINSATS